MARCRAALLLLVLALLLAPRTGHGAVSLGTNHSTTLRPNLFFGTRTRSPEPVMTGLAWFSAARADRMRHACEDDDSLRGWGWQRYDGHAFGQHYVEDALHGVRLNMSFVRLGQHSYVLRVQGRRSRHATPPMRGAPLSLLFSVTTPEEVGMGSRLGRKGAELPAALDGTGPHVGRFRAVLDVVTRESLLGNGAATRHTRPTAVKRRKGRSNSNSPTSPACPDLQHAHVLALEQPAADHWRVMTHARDELQRDLREAMTARVRAGVDDGVPAIPLLPNHVPGSGASSAVLQAVLQPPFVVDFAFLSSADSLLDEEQATNDGASGPDADAAATQSTASLPRAPSAADVAAMIEGARRAFDQRFHAFLTVQAPDAPLPPAQRRLCLNALSNVLGGLSYFYGASLVQRGPGQPEQYGPAGPLLTGVPSRSFFPRGFLWDEGFHQLLVHRWAPHITRDVLRHWFSRMEPDGWLPREQILGAEAESRVPRQFMTQRPDVANPPTLLLVVDRMLDGAGGGEAELELAPDGSVAAAAGSEWHADVATLRELWPQLLAWYRWYARTQAGPVPRTFRWRDRSPGHCLASGLDDYPRAEPPTEHEAHVDLAAWMAMASRSLARLARAMGDEATAAQLQAEHEAAVRVLLDWHWHEHSGLFLDRIASTDTAGAGEHVVHAGYVALLPLMLELLPPDSPRVGRLLDAVRAHQLVGPAGLRSLAPTSPQYRTGEDYWRGAVWVNMNFLMLRALHRTYGREVGPHQATAREVYGQVREALLANMAAELERTGYLWENYDAVTGRGRGTHPFAGWSALAALVAAENY